MGAQVLSYYGQAQGRHLLRVKDRNHTDSRRIDMCYRCLLTSSVALAACLDCVSATVNLLHASVVRVCARQSLYAQQGVLAMNAARWS